MKTATHTQFGMRGLLLTVLLASAGTTRSDSEAWSMAANMTTQRTLATAALLQDGSVLVAGGSARGDYHLVSAEVYDPQRNVFQLTGSLAIERHGASATTLKDGRVLVVGGYNASSQWLSDAELYNPATRTWTKVPPLYSHGVSHSATLLKDGRVLLVGGAIGSGLFSQRAELFNPSNAQWTAAAQLSRPRGGHSGTMLQDGRVLVAGGSGQIGDTAASTEIYDPISNTWAPADAMDQARGQHGAVLLADGRVLVAGGSVAVPSSVLSSAEVFDPRTGLWQTVGSMAASRCLHTLTALPDGNAIAVGGVTDWNWSSASFTRSVEVFDALGNSWEAGPSLNVGRCDHTASLLRDGRTFVAGGIGAGYPAASSYLASTEILELVSDREITSIGFSSRPGGPQATVAYGAGDTLYVRVQDVDAEGDTRTTIRLMLQQANRTTSIDLVRGNDGIYTGSVALKAFRPGPVTASVMAFAPGKTRLVKCTTISIVKAE